MTAPGYAHQLAVQLRQHGTTIAVAVPVLAAVAFIVVVMTADLVAAASAPINSAPLRW